MSERAWIEGGRGIARRWGAGVAAGLWLLAELGGCSSRESTGASCASQCGQLCQALGACETEVPSDCRSQCAKGVAGATCLDSRPPDQLTCAELKAAYACADYCATLCTRAPSCGSFDSKLCAQGCTTQSPSICNPASVDARTCDQLKPELRLYEDSARAEQGGSYIATGGRAKFGLCTDADDCEQPLGCNPPTNTCSPCESDGDCKRAFGAYICSAEKQCSKVACAHDEDCSLGVCDAVRHECVDCRKNADCTGFYKLCNVATATCGQCLTDADCGGTLPRCDLGKGRCEQCLTDADCEDSSRRCHPQFKYCTSL